MVRLALIFFTFNRGRLRFPSLAPLVLSPPCSRQGPHSCSVPFAPSSTPVAVYAPPITFAGVIQAPQSATSYGGLSSAVDGEDCAGPETIWYPPPAAWPGASRVGLARVTRDASEGLTMRPSKGDPHTRTSGLYSGNRRVDDMAVWVARAVGQCTLSITGLECAWRAPGHPQVGCLRPVSRLCQGAAVHLIRSSRSLLDFARRSSAHGPAILSSLGQSSELLKPSLYGYSPTVVEFD